MVEGIGVYDNTGTASESGRFSGQARNSSRTRIDPYYTIDAKFEYEYVLHATFYYQYISSPTRD